METITNFEDQCFPISPHHDIANLDIRLTEAAFNKLSKISQILVFIT